MNRFVAVLALAFLLQGCPTREEPKQTPVAPAQEPLAAPPAQACQRFLPIGLIGVGYALDTETGTTCKAISSANLEVPLCLDLWREASHRRAGQACNRFLPRGSGVGYALDTKTGTTCKTIFSANMDMDLCETLFISYPDDRRAPAQTGAH